MITLVGISFLPVKKMGDLYRLGIAGSKYGNQIAPSPTIFEREASKVTKYICSKIYICMTDLTGQIVACVVVEYFCQRRVGALVCPWRMRSKQNNDVTK
jgi:hypothetical protein